MRPLTSAKSCNAPNQIVSLRFGESTIRKCWESREIEGSFGFVFSDGRTDDDDVEADVDEGDDDDCKNDDRDDRDDSDDRDDRDDRDDSNDSDGIDDSDDRDDSDSIESNDFDSSDIDERNVVGGADCNIDESDEQRDSSVNDRFIGDNKECVKCHRL